MDSIGIKRPDCQICDKKESAIIVIRGAFMCGECVMMWQRRQNKKNKKEIEELKNAVCKF